MKIIRCRDEAEIDEARRIRYDFYVRELGVIPEADAPDGMIRDAHDEGARVFLGFRDGRPLITCRLIDIRIRPFEMAQYTDPRAFLTSDRAAEVTRLLCRPAGRHTALVWHMLAHIYLDCAATGVQHLYFSKREAKADPSLLTFFEKLGAQCVSERFAYGAYGPHRAYRIDLQSTNVQRLWASFRRRLVAAGVPL